MQQQNEAKEKKFKMEKSSKYIWPYLPICALPFDLNDCGLDSSENGDNGTELSDCNGEQDGVSE